MADPSRTQAFGEKLQAIQAAATIGAIVAGGIWTYMLFIQQRQRYAHLKIEHHVTHLSLPDHRILLIVEVTHANIGAVKVSLTSADVKIYTLQPQDLSDEVINHLNQGTQSGADAPNTLWEILADRPTKWKPDELVVEPGESDQLHYEFVFSDDVGPLLIYSYFRNPTITDRDIGWMTRSIYDPRKRAEPDLRSR